MPRIERATLLHANLAPKVRCYLGVPGMFNHCAGESPATNLMEVKDSKAQGRCREAGSEGSVEQKCEPMNKNRI